MPAADIVLKNASVITMTPGQPSAGLIAITGDRVSLVAGSDALEQVAGAGTRVIDCSGVAVVPGFNDAHCHVFSFLRKLLGIDLGPDKVASITDIKETVRRKAQKTPPGRWLGGYGFNEFHLAEKRYPTRRDIDEAAPDHPVVLSHRSLHACVLNSAALSLAGIGRETPDLPGGIIDRDLATGEPNGILFEMLGYIREKVMPPLTCDELDKALVEADRHYLSCGITSLQDASVNNDFNRWQMFRNFKESGKLSSRLSMMLGNRTSQPFQKASMTTGSGDSQLRLGAVKIMLTEASGKLRPSQDELNRQMLECHRAGFQVAFHAVQESAVEAAVTSLEYVDGHLPVARRRHRIEHCAECPPRLLERLKRLGAVIVTQPPFIYESGDRYLVTVAESQQPWLYRVKSMLQSGLTVAGSSDSPVAGDNPLVGIYAAVTRRTASGKMLLPGESVSPLQALEMYTTNAARASFEEESKGAIAPGKLADLAVLSDDPTHVPPEKIKEIRVMMTIIGGRVAWEG